MKDVTIKHVALSNFCNISSFDADFERKTLIKGFNKEGKSTIKNAILWVLTDKLSDGSAAGDNIRPHDEQGNRVDGVDIIASITVSIDGADYILTKTQKQKWVKKRGCEDREFQGNENLYEISGVPKKAKDFEQFINDTICPIAELPSCINANTFFSLDAKKCRAKILSLGKEFSNDEIIDKYPEFEELRNDLKVGTIEELTARSKKAVSELKKRQVELPTRIDEVRKSIIDMDFAEIELHRNEISNELQKIEASNAKATEIRKEINKAKIDLVTIKEKLSGSAKDMRHNLELSISNHKQSLMKEQNILDGAKRISEQLRASISNNEMSLQDKHNELNTMNNRVFDADGFVCPTCGQLFPVEMQEKEKAKFEQRKADAIKAFEEAISVLEETIADAKSKLPESEKQIKDIEDRITKIRSEISAEEMELSRITDDVDYSNDVEYKAVENKISDLETSLNEISGTNNKEELMSRLADVNRQLAQKDTNIKAEERIGELQEELKAVATKILDQERILHLLEQFNIKRIEMLEASVNQYFGMIKWKFWKQLINMGYQEVCEAEVNGTSYDGLLNKSDRLLCQLDLCNGFQKAAGVQLFLMVDDCESIDNGRIPETNNQLIMFRRDDCKLIVEGV